MTTKLNLIVLAAIAAASFVSTAQAAPAKDASDMSVRVSIAGLDISSPAGAKAVLGRIHQAARSICGAEPVVQDLSGRAAYSRCVSAITDRTVAALANPVVTAMNGGQSVVEVASTGR